MKEESEVKSSQIRQRLIHILTTVVDFIKKETNPKKIVEIATQKFSYQAVKSASQADFDPNIVILTSPKNRFDGIHALAIAISTGDCKKIEFLLTHFDKDAITNSSLNVWGYRQPYGPLHLALDPGGSVAGSSLISTQKTEAFVRNLKRIIYLLVEKGADPNYLPGTDIYDNPPMAAGQPRGWGYLDKQPRLELKALLLSLGPDPQLVGTSYRADKYLYMDGMLRILNQSNSCCTGSPELKASWDRANQSRIFTYQVFQDYSRS